MSSAKSAEPATDGKVFERIDAGKLQGALKNASVLTSLEVCYLMGVVQWGSCDCRVQQEGVPSHLLPALAQHQAADSAEEAAKKEKKRATKVRQGLGLSVQLQHSCPCGD